MKLDIKDVTTPELETYLMSLANLCAEAGDVLAEAESQFDYLDDLKNIVEATEMPDDKPEGMRKKIARTSVNYRQHIEGMKSARELYLKAKYKFKCLVIKNNDVQAILLKRFGSTNFQK